MKIEVDRFISDDDSTISRIVVDGAHVCFGLEDEFRLEKKPKETRIPAGTYKVGLRREGGFHQKYAVRFKDIHRGILHILDVPGFTHILIHCGNTQAETEGCLLVGSSATTDAGNMSVSDSSIAYKRFYPMVVDAAGNGTLEIEFVDNDR